jgi:hypothetical protein
MNFSSSGEALASFLTLATRSLRLSAVSRRVIAMVRCFRAIDNGLRN